MREVQNLMLRTKYRDGLGVSLDDCETIEPERERVDQMSATSEL